MMRLNWRQSILYFAVIGTEGCWLYALLALISNKVADARLSVWGILAIYPVAFIFNMLLRHLRWRKVFIQMVSWLGWGVGMLLLVKIQLFGHLPISDWQWLASIPQSFVEAIHTFRPELLIFLSSGVLWWLGQRLAHKTINFAAMVSEFQFGLIMLILVFISTSLLKTSIGNPAFIALTFFFFALLGISVTHALEGTSWLAGLHKGYWGGLLLVSIGIILILGLTISAIVTPELIHLLWDAMKRIWELIWGLIMKLMLLIASLFPEQEAVELPPMPNTPATDPSEGLNFSMPEWLRSSLRIGWIVLITGIFLFFLWRISSDIFRWLRRRLAGTTGAEFEPVQGALKADFLSLLRRILSWLPGLKLLFQSKEKKDISTPEVASVRQIYRKFLRWAAAGGYPRHTSQTPHEYGYKLAGLFPESLEDLDLVTQQYVKTRYGAWISTKDELDKLSQAWDRIKQVRLNKTATEHNHKKEIN